MSRASLPLLVAFALFMLMLTVPMTGPEVAAQDTAVTFLDNLNLSSVTGGSSDERRIGQLNNNNYRKAVPFDTGSNVLGYSLDSVTFVLLGFSSFPDGVAVAIHSDSSGSPGSAIGSLTPIYDPTVSAGRPRRDEEFEFISADGVMLAADTNYHVVISDPSGNESDRARLYGATLTNSGLEAQESGWNFTAAALNSTNGEAWTTPNANLTMQLRLKGQAIMPGVEISPQTLGIAEGASGTYTVVLEQAPANEVTVVISGTGVQLSETSLTFTTDNWNVAQTITVSVLQDNNLVNETITISHTSVSDDTNYSGLSIDSVDVTVDDDDEPAVVVPATFTLLEGGSGTYKMRLAYQPSGDVTVTINDPAGTSDISADTASLTFTNGNWSDEQDITIRAAEDDTDFAPDTATITYTVAQADNTEYQGLSVPGTVVTANDNDSPLNVSKTELQIGEGNTDTYTVVLRQAPPTGTATVTITLSDGSGVTLDETSLMFTADNYSVARTITVTAEQDVDAHNNTGTITNTLSGGGFSVSGVARTSVTVTDDETVGLVFSPEGTLNVTETETTSYSVQLASKPYSTTSEDVKVTITAGGDLTVSKDATNFSSSVELTFTETDWNTAQTITVKAGDDASASADTGVGIVHAATGADYAGTSATVSVDIADDDTPNLRF